jgi:hypothetical protein
MRKLFLWRRSIFTSRARCSAECAGLATVAPQMSTVHERCELLAGDFHAIAAAHNLLSALIDNHIHQGAFVRRMLHPSGTRRVYCGPTWQGMS